MGHRCTALLFATACLLITGNARGQAANSGDIRGTATDSTGALVADVTVTVLNAGTGVTKTLTTNSDGLFDTGPIVTGNYSVTFTKTGFTSFSRTGLNLDVATVTIDGTLKVGSTTEQVTVNTDVPLIQTESGEQSATLDFKTLDQLPNTGGSGTGPTWENFTTLIAGAAATPSAPLGNNPGQSVSVNGNLPYSSILSDGAESTLPSSANADTYVFEVVQEVKVSSSAFSAQYGVGGILFNQISKGGTNGFHGAAYEYNQNDAYNAKPYNFAGGPINKNRVRFNNFGGSIGGPILKDKAFFYFNYDQITNNSAVNGLASVPTLAERKGDFSAQLVPGVTCAATAPGGASSPGCIYDPNTQVNANGTFGRTPFPGNILTRIDPVANKIQAYFPAPNRPGTVHAPSYLNGTYTPGFTSNNYFYQGTQANPYKKYFGRLDLNLGSKDRLTTTVAKRDNPAFTINQNICPINCFSGDVDSTNAQVTEIHSFNGSFINEARFGYTNQLNFFVGQSFGGGFPQKIGLQYAKADGFPQINFSAGLLNLGPGINAIYKEHVFDPSDVVTLIRGRHILHFGGEFLINEDNSTAWGNLNPGTFGFTGDYTKGSLADKNSGVDYADFLLGTAHDWSAQVQPEYAGRQKTPQMFVQDDYKIRPNLTLNLGLRYQIQLGWKDAKNDQATFDPTINNPLTNTPGAVWFAANKTNGRTALQQNKYSIVLPRVGFAYTPHTDVVFRGGFGLYSYNWSLDQYGQGQGQAILTSGNVSDSTNGLSPVTTLAGTGANLPYALQSTDPGSKNGQSFNYVPYDTPVARIMQYNVGVEKQFGTNLAVQLSYVGSHGYNLVFPSGINQLTVTNLGKGQAARPYPQYQDLNGYQTGAISNYNSLQLSVTKRLSHGLSFDTNYVWSKFLDEADSSGWGSRAGTLQYQDPYNFRANYGPSNFDIRNAWKGSVIYNLPVGKGAQFLNSNRLVDAAIGGWRVSATFQLQDGNPFTPTINGGLNNSNALSSSNFRLRPNQIGNPIPQHRTLQAYFNTAAYATPAANTYGTISRNSLYGPGYESFNTSVGKTFHYTETIGLSIRADVNNVLNHATFGLPNTDTTSGGGQITSTSNQSRNMQMSARLAF